MKGDFTRDTFDPSKHYSRVLMQQGRVQLEADWNEQTAILLHYLRTLAKDILGTHAGPASELGFEIITKDMVPPAQLDAKIAAIEPDAVRRQALKGALESGNVVIGPGRYYLEGVLVENDRAVLYTEQPGYPFNSATTLDALKNWNNGLLYYLDVWEHHVTYVEDDHIREVALGGPDTCTRAHVVWQVKVLLQQDDGDGEFGCNAVQTLPPLGTGKLRARARLDKPPTELCTILPESRYRGAENQLYRVEIHEGGGAVGTGDANRATFKWSRENGSVVFPLRWLSNNTATLEHLGKDQHRGLKPGDWVEIVDNAIATSEKAGPLAQVDTVNRDELTVTLNLPNGILNLPSYNEADAKTKHALLRRWDHHPGDPKRYGGALLVAGQTDLNQGWIPLEDGVEIWFAADGEYRSGDYWLIPARVATGDVEWPNEFDGSGNLVPAARESHGPRHYYAPLLLIPADDEEPLDCRCPINPLPCVSYGYAFGGRAIGPDFL